MNRISKSILGILTGFILLFITTAFIFSDPTADFLKNELKLTDQVALSDISANNSWTGNFKSSVKFKQANFNSPNKEFYGQEIRISDNSKIEKILIGVTNNLISRIEIWNQNELIETKELGFMNKMTWGQVQKMTVIFYDQTNSKYSGQSKISMRFYSGTGFFGDIGTINLDLTEYGDLSGDKNFKLFAKSINSEFSNEPEFSDLQIWKNYTSFD